MTELLTNLLTQRRYCAKTRDFTPSLLKCSVVTFLNPNYITNGGIAGLSASNNKNNRIKIEQIFEKYIGMMIHIARQNLSDHALADDAVSESMEKIINNIDKINDISDYQTKAYIITIVKNTSKDILKKVNRDKENTLYDSGVELETISDISLSTLDKLTSAESYEAIVNAILTLPDTLKQPLYLSLVKHYSNAEIAEELEISYDATKMRLSRARDKIKIILAGDEYE